MNTNPALIDSDVRRKVQNFRKLMIMFPYVHPAALHGLIVKYKYHWYAVMELLFETHRIRTMKFWQKVADEEAQNKRTDVKGKGKGKKRGKYIKKTSTPQRTNN